MILCFSGTGNSLYAADLIGALTGDEVVSVNRLLKNGGTAALSSSKPFVFVCPTYAWRIPRVFERFIRETQLGGSTRAYFMMTCGDDTGNAAQYIQRLCEDKKLEFMGVKSVVMPENYVALYGVPGEAEAEAIVRKAEPSIREAAGLIRDGKPLPREAVRLRDRFMSAAVNPVFYKFIVKAKDFRATDSCTGCGVCAGLCPLNNIRLESDRPVWGTGCTHCMACICRCPSEAIEYGKKTQGKPRYVCKAPD